MEPNNRTWKNVYTLRQEYNKYRKRWYPVVVYWNCDGRHRWLETLATDDGVTFYHAEISEGYFRDGTKHGTGHCTPEEVNRILDYYKDENPDTFRVERLGIYRPRT